MSARACCGELWLGAAARLTRGGRRREAAEEGGEEKRRRRLSLAALLCLFSAEAPLALFSAPLALLVRVF
jgi:hypothetical protein